MPYDASVDQCLFKKEFESQTSGKLVVSVYSYNQGAKKLQITRENQNADGETRFAKLGRMTKEEAEGILPLMQEALKHMD